MAPKHMGTDSLKSISKGWECSSVIEHLPNYSRRMPRVLAPILLKNISGGFRLLSLKTQPPEEDRAGRVVCCCSGSWRLNDPPKVTRKFCKGK